MDYNIKNYDYKSIDKSLLAPYYKKICQYIINYIPQCISPNIVTLFGLAISMFSTIMVVYYRYIWDHVILCYICFVSLFMYQLIDILDGMQAGKVGMYYNPTTELFDHGCDSVTTICITYNVLVLSGAYEREFMLSMIFSLCIMINFYIATWQHSNTKIMEFRAGLLNPTEMIFTIKCTFLLLSIYPNILYGQEVYLVLFVVAITLIHFILAVQETFLVSTNSDIVLVSSLLPIFLSIYQLYQYEKYNMEYGIINIAVPMILGIIELLWLEISGEYMNGKTIYLFIYVYVVNMFVPGYMNKTYLAPLLSVILVINKFMIYVDTMCNVLDMGNFYDIPRHTNMRE